MTMNWKIGCLVTGLIFAAHLVGCSGPSASTNQAAPDAMKQGGAMQEGGAMNEGGAMKSEPTSKP